MRRPPLLTAVMHATPARVANAHCYAFIKHAKQQGYSEFMVRRFMFDIFYSLCGNECKSSGNKKSPSRCSDLEKDFQLITERSLRLFVTNGTDNFAIKRERARAEVRGETTEVIRGMVKRPCRRRPRQPNHLTLLMLIGTWYLRN